MHAFTSIFTAAGLAGALLPLCYLALRKPVLFITTVVVVWVLTVAVTASVPLDISIYQYRVSAMDILTLVMAICGGARMLLNGIRSTALRVVALLLALLVIHISRGIGQFGLEAALNSARPWCYFFGAMAYVATVPGGWDRRLWRAMILAGVILAATAIPFWLMNGLGSAEKSVIRNGELVTTRPIVAAGALLILQATILLVALRWPSKRKSFYIALGLSGALMLLQHRTIWVAGVAAAAAGIAWWSAGVKRIEDKTAFAAIGIALLLLPAVAIGVLATGPLVQSAESATAGHSTFTWRTTGWEELIASHSSFSDIAVGGASGESFARRINGEVIDVSAHNGFVEAYLRFGSVGAIVLLWLGLILWRRRRRIAAVAGLTAPAVGLILLTQLAFSIAYSLDVIQGIILGVFVSGATVSRGPSHSQVHRRISQLPGDVSV